jgi:hypothetical protein
VIACNDWLRLGPGRSLSRLAEKYNEGQRRSAPSRSLTTLQKWSSKYGWAERATAFDVQWEQLKNQEREAELNFGLALDYERVRKLKRLADFLEAQLYEQGIEGQFHNVWLPDVKNVGYGEDAEKVDIERFNAALITQYRETLEDLAAEVGGRVKRQEVSGKDGGPIAHEVKTTVDSSGFNQALSGLAQVLGTILSGTSPDPNGAVGSLEPTAVVSAAQSGR